MDEGARIDAEVVHPGRRGTRPMTAEVLWSMPRVGAPVVAPDGRHIAVVVTTYDVEADRGAARVWLVPTGGGIARPLTSPERDATEPSFSPDGRRLAFTTRLAGGPDRSAARQVAVLSLEGGEAEVLTDLPLGAFDPQWLPDGSGLVFGAWLFAGHLTVEDTRAERQRRVERPVRWHVTEDRLYRYWDTWLVDGRLPHLFVMDLASKEVRDLLPASELDFDWMEPSGNFDIAPDAKSLVFTGIERAGGPGGRPRRDVYRLAVGTGRPECLTGAHPVGAFGARWLPDGETVVYGYVEDPDFYADRVRLATLHVPTRRRQDLLTRWDRSPESWRPLPGGGLVFEAEDEGRRRVFVLPAGAPDDPGSPRRLTEVGSAHRPVPGADGRVWFVHDAIAMPPEVARVPLAGGALERVTSFTAEALEGVALGEVHSAVFEGAGGVPVQMFLLLPPEGRGGAPRPLVHWIHGGPHGTFGDTWHWRWCAQVVAARGWLVAMVNFQGSTSFGQDFGARIQGAWGDRPAGDVLAATDLLVGAGWADPERMAIAGGSYGGYLTAWLASTTDRFRCAVNHAGVYDLGLQYASDHTFSWRRAAGGEPWDGRDRMDRWDPARHADGLSTPMLVVHGERDFRVPVDHALLCYGVLKAKGVPARLVYFEDENHWILRPQSSLRWYAEVLGWLARFLTPRTGGPS